MLYEAERHETLTASAWNEQAALACIDEILNDTVEKFSARDLWPSHPLDSFSPDARWNLYVGAAGTIWALHHLSRKLESLPDFSSGGKAAWRSGMVHQRPRPRWSAACCPAERRRRAARPLLRH